MNNYIKSIVEAYLNEINNSTIVNAANKVGELTKHLLEPNGKNDKNIENNYKINSDNFEEYLNTLQNQKQKDRLIKLYQSGKLVPLLLRRKHVLSTIANSNLGWFSEHNISLSPEFYEGENGAWTANYKNTSRKPTDKEHKFYRYYVSLGSDTVGMSEEEKAEFKKILSQYWLDTTGIDPTI